MREHYPGSPEAMQALGAALAHSCRTGAVVYLEGELGTGKTTLVRGFLHALGHQDRVKSPTFTLLETYDCNGRTVVHIDLYRLAHGAELDDLGVREYFLPDTVCLIEWAEKGGGALPAPDLRILIRYHDRGRQVLLETASDLGREWLERMKG